MKRWIAYILMIFMLLSGTTVFADMVISENFDAISAGRFSISGWTLTDTDEANGTVLVVERGSGDMAVRLEKNETPRERAKGVKKVFEPQSQPFTIEMDIKMADGEHFINLFDSSTSFPPAVMLSVKAGTLAAYNADAQIEQLANLNYGTWSTLKIYVQPRDGVYSVYIDNQLVVNRFAMRVAQPRGINSLSISTAMITGATAMEFDTVKGYTGLPEGAELDEEGNLPPVLTTPEPPVDETPREEIYAQSFDGIGSELSASEWSITPDVGEVTIEKELAGRTDVLKFSKAETDTEKMLLVTCTLPESIDVNCTVEMWYMHDANSKAGGLAYIFDDAGSNPSGPAIFLSNNVTAFNGGTQDALNPDIKTGEWYKLAIYIRPSAGTYDIYVNDKMVGDGLQFRNTANKNVKRIVLGGTNTAAACIGAIDDFRVYTGTPELPAADEAGATGGAVGTSGQKIMLKELTDYAQVSTPRLAKAVVMMVDKYTAFVNNSARKIDENNLMVKPVIVDDRTLLPVRFITESLGGTVAFDEESGRIDLAVNGKEVVMTLNETTMQVDGQAVELDVPAQTLSDRTMIPLRAMAEAVGKKVFWDDSGLIIISDNENVFNPVTDAAAIAYVARQFDHQSELHSPSAYSDVFLSSRWFRTDGQDGQLGTLDIMKQYMATGDKWSYITSPGEISPIINLGATFQTSINVNMGGDSAMGKLFDGTYAVAPWMSWGAKWNCMNNTEYHQILKNAVKSAIDKGVTQVQFDDWAGNVAMLNWGGCFCDYCMTAFSKYLKENYTAAELKELEIDDVGNFNFKTFMEQKYGAKDNTSYLNLKSKTKLTPIFEEFQLISTRNTHIMLREYMDEYAAGKQIQYSHNSGNNIGNGFSQRTNVFCYDVFDGAMGESGNARLTADTMVSTGYLSAAIDNPFIYSPLPDDGNYDLIRMSIPLAYATGQYILVPWDTWLHDSVRYFADVEEYGDLFHFIRQYPYLFDNYEVPAKIGIIADLDNTTPEKLRSLSFDLFSRGVSFKDIVSKRDIPQYEIDAQDLSGIQYILELTPISNLREEEQKLIEESGIPIISMDDLTESFLSGLQTTQAEAGAGSEVYTVLREITNNPGEPKVVHVLNRSGYGIDNLRVRIAESDLFWGEETEVMLYAPGQNPQKLPVESENGYLTVTLPEIDLWGVLRISPAGTQFKENFPFRSGWSGINLGTRPEEEDFAEELGNGSFAITAKGRGFNVATPGDSTGSQEQMPYVYQNFNISKLQNYGMQARLDENNGMAGIMIREYPNANARFVAVYQEGDNLKLAMREKNNASVSFADLGPAEGKAYLRLESRDGKMSVYASENGQSFGEALNEIGISMLHPLGGIFCASPDGTQAKAVFSDAELEGLDMLAGAAPAELNLTVPKSRITIGKYQVLTATCTTQSGDVLTEKDFDITYASSDPQIVAIDSKGRMDAFAEGTATITATVTIAGVTAQTQVTVTAAQPSQDIFDDNFDRYNGDQLPDDWEFSDSGAGGSYARIVQEPADYDKSICIYDNTTTSDTKATYVFEETCVDPVVFEFDYMVRFGAEKKNGGANILYTYGAGDNYGICLFASPTHFWYIDLGEQKNICEIEENRWYKIMIEAYPQEQRMNFYLDGQLIMENAGFRTGVSEFTKMQIGGNVNAVDTTSFWNNFKVYLQK